MNGFITISIIISGGVNGLIDLLDPSHGSLRFDKMSEVCIPLCQVVIFMVTATLVHEQWFSIVMC